NPTAWYSLHRSREKSLFEQEKIITPEISLGTNMTLDTENFYHNTKCYSLTPKIGEKQDIKFWLAIMNSNLLWFYLSNTGYVLRGGFFTFKTKYLEPFPLPALPKNKNDFTHKVEEQLRKTEFFNLQLSKFEKFFTSNYSLSILSKKLQNWHKIEFVE